MKALHLSIIVQCCRKMSITSWLTLLSMTFSISWRQEFGDLVDIDGYDVDYGNEVLTLKLGSLGTYVINKQTPNRQIWMSSPISGPSRFDWDQNLKAWVYRRTKANLLQVLESELGKLCATRITLS